MHKQTLISLVDCPRDAIQGVKKIIPTADKISYINGLLQSGLFDYIDFGSFVSPKAVPQLADTSLVLEGLESKGASKLIAIIANERGAELGRAYRQIDYLGYPFSVSDTFQQRNTNRSSVEAFSAIQTSQAILSDETSPELMVYMSMAFGNPYGDHWHPEMVGEWMDKLVTIGVRKFSIADTTSAATPDAIEKLCSVLYDSFPKVEMSVHLHSRPETALAKVEAAFTAGCRIFEGAVMGYGGCPFAQDELVGNISSELLLKRFRPQAEGSIDQLTENFRKLISHAV